MTLEQKIDQILAITEARVDDFGIPDPKPGKGIDELKKVVKPLENGWTFEEIYSALKGTILALSRQYSTPTFSSAEAASMAFEAIQDAVKNDKGLSNFASYVYSYLKSKMRREAARSSNLSGVPYSSGGKEDYLAGSRATVSADAPMDDEGRSAVGNIPSPEGSENEGGASKARRLLDTLLDLKSVGLSDTEKQILRDMGGLGGAPARPVGEIARERGVSPARISQLRAKAFEKLKEYLDARKFKDPAMASQGLGLESKIQAGIAALMDIIIEAARVELQAINENLGNKFYTDIITDLSLMHESAILGKKVVLEGWREHNDGTRANW